MGSKLSRFNNENQILQNNVPIKRLCLTGDHESHVSDGAEGDLHTLNAVCEKNPGHTKFIPVDIFTLKHLPKRLQEVTLLDLVKAVADLTVKVNVKMTSSHRPPFWPKTNDPYPFYLNKEDDLRTGSGMVNFVYKFINGVNKNNENHRKNYKTCWCRRCKQSDSRSTVWWEFYTDTAAHLVFDNIETRGTSLTFFYDSKNSPFAYVNKVVVVDVDVGEDWCWLNCVTCDKNLGDKLDKMWKRYCDVWNSVWKRYTNYKTVQKFSFIVSHPHGCYKQVSVGHWIKKIKVDEVDRKFTYTTCTCPGSSGAILNCVGYRGWAWPFNQYIHSRTNSKHKYNYSAVG